MAPAKEKVSLCYTGCTLEKTGSNFHQESLAFSKDNKGVSDHIEDFDVGSTEKVSTTQISGRFSSSEALEQLQIMSTYF